MSERITTGWLPSQDLTALLDALTEELLASPDHEVPAELHDGADERGEAAGLVRRLIAAADAEAAPLPTSFFKNPGLRAYVTRNQ